MSRLLIGGAIALTVPAMCLRLTGFHLAPPIEALLFGLAVLGAAFVLSWVAEVAQLEISQALALAIVALIAVLPEYAVDLYFAWAAAERPEYAGYATANMTGANRLLVGLGWPVVVLVFGLRFRRSGIRLEPGQAVDVAFLGVATIYALVIPIKGGISLIDTAVLFALFGGYMWRTAHAPRHEPELVGPAELLGRLPRRRRRAATLALFLYSGLVILLAAEPFAEALVESGEPLGVDEFLLVQWVAPLASEAPEFIIASLWAFRGDARAGLGALLSSKVNQWTLLIGTIPVAYSIGLGRPGSLPLDLRQEHELWLTAAQSLFAVAVLVDLRLGLREAVLLFILFAAQFLFPDIHIEAAIAYTVLAILYLAWYRGHLGSVFRRGIGAAPRQ